MNDLPVFDAVADLRQIADAAVAGQDVEELAAMHVAFAAAVKSVREYAGEVEAALLAVMPDKRLELPGLPVLERKQGAKRNRWQSEDLVRLLVARSITDGDGCLIDQSPQDAAHAVADEILACAPITPSTGWRVTALRDRDIDVDEWCETEWGAPSVMVHKTAEVVA